MRVRPNSCGEPYFQKPLEDLASQWKERLRIVYKEVDLRHGEGQWPESVQEWLERAYMMEAAVLLSTLTELPFEAGRARRKRLHDEYLSSYREIKRKRLSNPTLFPHHRQ